ncbi:MAG: hypothetical protein U0872_01930 [Planctomycetaceae bacterium]
MPPTPAEMPSGNADYRETARCTLAAGGKMFHGSHGGCRNCCQQTCTRPPKNSPEHRLSIGHYEEWLAAIKGGPKPVSNFEYAGPMTETVLLGVLAMRSPGQRLEWDKANLKVKNVPEVGPSTCTRSIEPGGRYETADGGSRREKQGVSSPSPRTFTKTACPIWLSAIRYPLSAIRYPLSAIRYPLSAINSMVARKFSAVEQRP